MKIKTPNKYSNNIPPVEIYYFYFNNYFYNTRNIIIVKNNTNKIIEKYYSFNIKKPLWHNIVNEIFIKKNSKLEYYKIQNDSRYNIIFDNTFIKQYSNTSCKLYTFSLKNKLLLHNVYVTQSGKQSNSIIKNITYPKINYQIIHHETIINHEKSDCHSKEIYKSIIKNKVNFNFYGKIIINKHIDNINAYQQNNNIILTNNSVINIKPELDIYSNNVKCSHGCTVSEINNDIIFYMRTRGINKKTAKKLFIKSFLQDIIKTVSVVKIKKELLKKIYN